MTLRWLWIEGENGLRRRLQRLKWNSMQTLSFWITLILKKDPQETRDILYTSKCLTEIADKVKKSPDNSMKSALLLHIFQCIVCTSNKARKKHMTRVFRDIWLFEKNETCLSFVLILWSLKSGVRGDVVLQQSRWEVNTCFEMVHTWARNVIGMISLFWLLNLQYLNWGHANKVTKDMKGQERIDFWTEGGYKRLKAEEVHYEQCRFKGITLFEK